MLIHLHIIQNQPTHSVCDVFRQKCGENTNVYRLFTRAASDYSSVIEGVWMLAPEIMTKVNMLDDRVNA